MPVPDTPNTPDTPDTLDSPREADSVAAAFAAAARRWPQQPFLGVLEETAHRYRIEPGDRSYSTVLAQIERLRERYRQSGYRPGHRVGLMLENRPDFFSHWIALNGLGVSVVPVSLEARAAEFEYLIGHSEMAALVAPRVRHEELQAAARRAARPLVVFESGEAPLAAPVEPRSGLGLESLTGFEAECALLYTSGTTGQPKGCMLPNRYFLQAGLWYADIGGLATLREACERMLTPLPLTHMNAMAYSSMAMIMTGGCLILLDRFHPSTWWESVRASRATVVHYLGVMPAMLIQDEPSVRDREHSVRFGFGAGVDPLLHDPFEKRFGFPLLEAWAMTETGAGAVIMANREPRHVGTRCFGRELDEVAVRIVTDDGRDAPAEEPGELWVRCAGADPRQGFFAGYFKDETATAEAWAGDWFHTGDIVHRGLDGQLHFVDRRKNVIRRSGENISAVEVESVLNRHPAVRAAAVAATPDAVRGDEVLALVVTHETCSPETGEALARALVEWSLEQLAYFKAPGYVAFVEDLPLTSSQKIQRGELKRLAASLPGQPHCIDTRAMKRRQA